MLLFSIQMAAGKPGIWMLLLLGLTMFKICYMTPRVPDFDRYPCSFATGGEDGYVRLQHFDAGYFNMINKTEL